MALRYGFTVLSLLSPLLIFLSTVGLSAGAAGLGVEVTPVVHTGTPFSATLTLSPPRKVNCNVVISVWNLRETKEVEKLLTRRVNVCTGGGVLQLEHEVQGLIIETPGISTIRFRAGDDEVVDVKVTCIYGWMSLVPPLLSLVLSMLFKQVIVALLVGVWSGALLVSGFCPLAAFLRTFDKYFVGAFTEEGNAEVLLFTFLLGGTIGLVQRSGGADGLANSLKRFMGTRMKGQICTVALAALLFFDDYSSILIVGNSLKVVVGTIEISRAKFAWLVHSVGVALVSLSPVSSWVGLQIGYINNVLSRAGAGVGATDSMDGFLVVLSSIPYRFFPLFYLFLVLAVVITGKDLGPMAEAERQGVAAGVSGDLVSGDDGGGGGGIQAKEGTPLRSRNALMPFGAVIVITVMGMILDGISKIEEGGNQVPMTMVNILSTCDSVSVLIWASAGGWVVSMVLVTSQAILGLHEAMDTWMEGMKEVLEPQFVLVLAWALGRVVREAQTAEFLARALEAGINPTLLPSLISILCFVISYSCGSTFGTMGIVFPLVGPLALQLGGGDPGFVHHCFGSILAAATFGNVCSPISDTTILTSLATGCDITEHVGTITHYTLFIGALSILLGSFPVGMGYYGPWTALVLGALTVFGLIYGLGRAPSRRIESPPPVATQSSLLKKE